jgi:hypothetical protein
MMSQSTPLGARQHKSRFRFTPFPFEQSRMGGTIIGNPRTMVAPGSHFACIEKRRLLKTFADAVSEYNRIQSAQVAAVMNGDGFQFQDELAVAEARRENAKYAVLLHEEEHGC